MEGGNVKYGVAVTYMSTSTTYRFSPFTEDEAEKFADKAEKSDPEGKKISYIEVFILNDPADFGTGMEMA